MNYIALSKLLIENGLTFVGSHSIEAPKDIKYHVSCEWARENTFVFHKRGTQLILIVSHHEAKRVLDYDDYNHVFWSIQFLTRAKSYKELLASVPIEKMRQHWAEMDRYWSYDNPGPSLKFIGYNEYPVLDGFQSGSISCGDDGSLFKYEQLNAKVALPISDLVCIIMKAVNEMLPNLASGRFKNISLYHFYNSYAFNDGEHSYFENTKAEQLFRERFNLNYLRQAVGNYK